MNGKLHREGDLPAIQYPDGSRRWYKNDKLHRDNNLPSIINFNAKKGWFSFFN
jgi:hypothetical protein